jgi:hypothetical protein
VPRSITIDTKLPLDIHRRFVSLHSSAGRLCPASVPHGFVVSPETGVSRASLHCFHGSGAGTMARGRRRAEPKPSPPLATPPLRAEHGPGVCQGQLLSEPSSPAQCPPSRRTFSIGFNGSGARSNDATNQRCALVGEHYLHCPSDVPSATARALTTPCQARHTARPRSN